MNVARVNADSETELGTRFGIRSFPTIKLITAGSAMEYRGPMTLEALETFALGAASATPIGLIKAADFPRLREEHEVSVVFAFDPSTSKGDMLSFIDAANSWMIPTIKGVYATVDASFTSGKRPVVLVYRRGFNVARYPPAVDTVEAPSEVNEDGKSSPQTNIFTSQRIRTFVRAHRYPILPELDVNNAPDIMDGVDSDTATPNAPTQMHPDRPKRLIIMGVLDPEKSHQERRVLQKVAEKLEHKHDSQMNGIPLRVVWLNGMKWTKYVERVYGFKSEDLPRLILSVPQLEEFFAHSEDKGPIPITEESIMSALNDVVQQVSGSVPMGHGRLKPSSSRGRVIGLLKEGWRTMNNSSPFYLVTGMVMVALFLWWVCCKRPQSQVHDAHKWD
jgi:hypothetical protein